MAHPTRAGELYAVTYWGGLHKSVDGGESWVTMGQGNRDTGNWIALDRLDPDTFYVASYRSVLVTHDGGVTFEQKPIGPHSFTPRRVEVSADSSILYAVETIVRRSTDGGESWTDSYTAPPGPFLSLVTHPTRFRVAFLLTRDGLLQTLNGGQSWEPLGTGLPIPFEGLALGVSPANPQVLLAASTSQGVYRSGDGGMTWVPVSSPLLSSVREFVADPAVGGQFLALGSPPDGLALSDDRGETWASIGPLAMRLVQAAAFDPSVASRIYAGVSVNGFTGELFRTEDLGKTWSPLVTDGLFGGVVWSVAAHPSRSSIAYAGSQRGVHRTRDHGRTWEFLSPLPGIQELLIDSEDPRRLWAAAYQGVQQSLDGGLTWSPTSNGLPAETPFDIAQDPSQSNTLYVALGTVVYKSTDGADSWNPTGAFPLALFPRAVAIDSADPAILYAGGSGYPNPSLYRSEDGGANWDSVPDPLGLIADVTVDPTDPSVVYALNPSILWKSTDRGISFSPLPTWNSGGPEGTNGIGLRLDPSNPSTLYVLDWLGVFRSPDAGQTWHRLTIESFAGGFFATDLALSADGRTLFQANFGGVFTFERRWDDVPDTDPFFPSADLVALHGVTAGCGGGDFCPSDPLSRAESSAFLLRSLEGSIYEPPPATGAVFSDVPANAFAAAWIEEMSDRGITAGCGFGLFCPDLDVTRAQAAVLNLRTKNGTSYQSPPATGTMFADVPASHFAAAWIEEFARQGYTAGCAPNLFCPEQAVSRGQMAVFLAAVFTLL